MRRFFTLVRANLLMLLRNRQALFWSLAFPLVFMFLLGVVFGNDNGNRATVGLVDADNSRPSQALVAAFGHVDALTVQRGDQAELRAKLERGDLAALVVIPRGFDQALVAAGAGGAAAGSSGGGASGGYPPATNAAPASLNVSYDPSSLFASQVALGIVNGVVDGFQKQLRPTADLIRVQTASIQRSGLKYRDFLIPGVLALALLTSGVIGIATTVVEYRQQGILRRVQVTPLPVSQFMGGRVLTQMLVSLLQALVLLGVGRVVFGVAVVGSYLALVALLVVGTLAFVTIGFFIASFTHNVEATSAVGNVVTLPMMFLGGIFFPVDNAPDWIRPVVNLMPVKYLADGLRDIMIRGYGFGQVWTDFVFLAGTAVVFGLLSVRVFRWRE